MVGLHLHQTLHTLGRQVLPLGLQPIHLPLVALFEHKATFGELEGKRAFGKGFEEELALLVGGHALLLSFAGHQHLGQRLSLKVGDSSLLLEEDDAHLLRDSHALV